jgi:hypothetical protein
MYILTSIESSVLGWGGCICSIGTTFSCGLHWTLQKNFNISYNLDYSERSLTCLTVTCEYCFCWSLILTSSAQSPYVIVICLYDVYALFFDRVYATITCSRFLLGSNSVIVHWMCIWGTVMITEMCIRAYIESGIPVIWNLGVFLLLLLAGTFFYEFGIYCCYTCCKCGIHVIPIINLEHFAMNFCAGDLNECPFIAEISIYFRFSKNRHSLLKVHTLYPSCFVC